VKDACPFSSLQMQDAGRRPRAMGSSCLSKIGQCWPHDHHLPVLPGPQSGLTVPCCHQMSLNLWDHEDSFLLLQKRTKECDFRNLSKELLSQRFWSKGKDCSLEDMLPTFIYWLLHLSPCIGVQCTLRECKEKRRQEMIKTQQRREKDWFSLLHVQTLKS
jgi:hypothetical protein